ncbi:MAG: DotA/TraY family protein, partial [Rhodospirillales bacterium]|nr:DotA/TraY family protein [Rhodospirillales bacterium]
MGGRWPALVAAAVVALVLAGGGSIAALAQGLEGTGAEHEGFALHHAQAFFADEIGDPLTSIFLNELFGPLFPSAAGGRAEPTVFSQVIGYFNVIVLVLGGLLFSWNFTAGLLQTAHTGRLLGDRWSSLWAPLRVTLAVGLLVPLPHHGGYNAVQAGIAYVVRGATLSASWFWGQAAETILAGQVPIARAAPQLDPKTARTLYSIAACHQIVQDSLNAAGTTSLWIETPTLEMARINAT